MSEERRVSLCELAPRCAGDKPDTRLMCGEATPIGAGKPGCDEQLAKTLTHPLPMVSLAELASPLWVDQLPTPGRGIAISHGLRERPAMSTNVNDGILPLPERIGGWLA